MYEYWIGENVNYKKVWTDYEAGSGYIKKFDSTRVHLIQIEFDQFPKELPLFNHEAIYKTIKGYFHDLKRICLSQDEYEATGPLYLYDVRRGSEVWNFLGELRQLILFGTTLADEKVVGQKLDNIGKRLEILQKHFGDSAKPRDFERFMNAETPAEIDAAIQKLFKQKLRNVKISKAPFEGNIEKPETTLVDIKLLLSGQEE